MKSKICRFVICAFALMSLAGCGALVAGGAVVGAGAGTYLYANGELKTDYAASLDSVWSACERTVAEMRGTQVHPVREISKGTISAIIHDENVKIEIVYRAKNQTTVGVRVGLIGNKLSSQVIHDKIAGKLEES
ncbi:MAG: DUF3568 family protein [Smithella sp.]|jgi:hypothetical protein|nr:DUF3568 family protein [Smithellaceae bacterium]NLA40467.1 DUF3568 family protein [Smithella sp.]